MSQEYFAELYEMTGNPRLAMEYITMMRAMEVAGVVTLAKPTVH